MASLLKTSSPSGNIVVLSTAFLPPVEWFRAAALSSCVLLEGCETYQKQSYRTRSRILTAGGVETLNVPVAHGGSRQIRDMVVDYSEPWVQRIERALTAAYMSSPFFIYYQDDLFPLLRSGEESLFEYNLKLIQVLAELLGLRLDVKVTQEFVPVYGEGYFDFRNSIHPKRPVPSELLLGRPYYQVFSSKFGFVPSLSVLDLLFNEGPNAISFLL